MGLLFRVRGWFWGAALLAAVLLLLGAVALAAGAFADWRWLLVAFGVLVVAVFLAGRARRWVPRRTVLEVDFERGVVERSSPGWAGRVRPNRPFALRDVLDALQRAGEDDRVVGLVARIGSFRPGLAVAQELRDAVLAFRARGKRAVAWAETIGEGGSATVEYYLASAFDRIHLVPVGEVGLDGVLVRHPFLRGTFDKVGIDPQFGHRREYKTAKYLFTERAFNEAHRESTQTLLDSQVDQLVEGIATGRGIDAAVVRELVDRGPFEARDAVDAGLVDRLSYRDEVYDGIKEESKARFLHLERYLKRAGRPNRKGQTIAFVHAVGPVARGRGGSRSLFGGTTMGSDDVAAALRRAAKAKRVKAVVLRIDSPGGSAVASDVVWREILRTREKGTPVVASMGNVAASGGYYIAMGADRIVAQPGTITGSIGVVWGKFVTREAWKRVGIDWDSLQFGRNADLWSAGHDFGEKGWAKVEGLLDAIYDDFTGKVAESRSLSKDDVEAVAKGRVWTGAQAKESGLVDDLGGVGRALEAARELAGLPTGAALRLKVMKPYRKTLLGTSAEDASEAAAASFPPLRRALGLVAHLDTPGPLTMPPLDSSLGP